MAILDWPVDLVPAKTTWGLQSNTEAFTSPLNRATQTMERPGARWKVTLEFPPMNEVKRGRLEGFLAGLGGQAGRFNLWPHQRPSAAILATPRDATLVLDFLAQSYQVDGLPVVNGAMANFKLLPTKYWPASTLVLRAGEFLSVGGELKMVTVDVASDAAGSASIPVAPAFRIAPADGAVLKLSKPTAKMMLATDEYSVAVTPGRISDVVVVSVIEDLS
ncbi:hypothetical protein [Cupriavidus basilensis]|uniref:hypothetical protein n=1 Tax=Cupriavidus basilensis TaxID=68895 RepID=UPI00157AEFF7|nr:hypothetical protein [Cupriavidus basilensis]NUA26103.1 hypothetical protein [Cupriavidus basilensis]